MLTRTLLLVAAIALTACPRRGGNDGTGPGTGTGSGTAKQVDAGVAELPVREPGKPLLPPDGVDPRPLACVYHTGGAGYFTCTNGNAGLCFHYGAPCNPTDPCMYDPASSKYKTCASPVEGTCASWGATCTPNGACMVDPKDGLHRSCSAPDDGACKSWGALCDPAL